MSSSTGKILRYLRRKNSLTQKELAEKLNKAESTISMWERGDREIDQETLVLIADLFNVSVDFLIGRTSNPEETRGESLIIDDDFSFALYDMSKDLTEAQKRDILKIVNIIKNQGKE